MSDQSFIAQIQETEEKGAALVSDAHQAQGENLSTHQSKLVQERASNLEKAREKSREKLKEQQQKAKGLYAQKMEDSKKDADSLKKNAQDRMSSALSSAEAHFLGLLGAK